MIILTKEDLLKFSNGENQIVIQNGILQDIDKRTISLDFSHFKEPLKISIEQLRVSRDEFETYLNIKKSESDDSDEIDTRVRNSLLIIIKALVTKLNKDRAETNIPHSFEKMKPYTQDQIAQILAQTIINNNDKLDIRKVRDYLKEAENVITIRNPRKKKETP